MARRLFIALDIPNALHERLGSLGGGVPKARWVAQENYHITLSFIGDVEEHQASDIHDVLERLRHRAFVLTPSGTGRFGTKAPKLLWAGLERSYPLKALHEKVSNALTRAGFLEESRSYRPHITLAYLGSGDKTLERKVAQWLEATGAFLGPSFEVNHFTLFESTLGRGGSTFRALHTYPLDCD
jgi:RNA 2',3'-cyclic 3'-phosphodiesterase